MKKLARFFIVIILLQSCSIESGSRDFSFFWNSLQTQLSQLLPKTRREIAFFALGVGSVGITAIALLPKILRTIREKFKMPWTILTKAWREEYQEKVINLREFPYKKRRVKANIVHLYPRGGFPARRPSEILAETYAEKIRRTKFDPNVKIQEDLAILFLPGLGDIWQLMASAQHQELFPTLEFYVAQFPDSQEGKTLKTTVGGVDEALIALLCLWYLASQKNEDGEEKYNRIVIFSESRGGAVLDLMQAFLDNWYATKSKSFFDQKPDDDPLITYRADLQYDYAQILEKANIKLDKDEVNNMQKKLNYGGFVYLSPLESYSGVAKLIASALPTRVLQKMGGYVLNKWAAPNLTYYDPKEQKDPMIVRKDWVKNQLRRVFYSPTNNDDVLGNATNETAKDILEEKVTVFYESHEGIHIKMEDPIVRQQLWNFISKGDPE